jgi:hypothetical protein
MFAIEASSTAHPARRLRAPLWLALAALLLKLAIGLACLGADNTWGVSAATASEDASCVAGEASCHGDCNLVATPVPLMRQPPRMPAPAHVVPMHLVNSVPTTFEESFRPPIA